MPITKGALKAHKASLRKRVFNVRRKRALGSAVKEIRENVAAGKLDEAQKLMPTAQKAIDKAAKRGIIKKKTAARKISRLNKAVTADAK